jgi:diguanylate cyclase (GGDEF)-like protein
MIVAAALTAAPILMVSAGTGLGQIDWQLYFFVVLGLLVAYVDWRPILVSAALAAAHHAVVSVILPRAVFPQSDLLGIYLNVTMVVVDAIVLVWIVRQMSQLFSRMTHTNDLLEARITERTIEINELSRTLARTVCQLESASTQLENDAADRKIVAARLDHLAHHDLVTGLPNRVLLMDRLGVALATAERAGTCVLVIYLDLDNFKQVNDTTGHAAGDQALASIATRLRGCMRTGDTASRVGGDEFVLVCSLLNAVTEAAQIAERVIAAVSEPMDIGSGSMTLGASIGMSFYPADGSGPEQLITKADAAMYRAKQSGRNRFHLYTSAIHADMLEKSTLKRDLEDAIARDEFVVYYQPIVSLTSRAIIGAEALVRWMHPTRGLLTPDEFIGFAERHGFITRIGEIVLHKACAQINRFALGTNDEFTMAVNVSAIQFRQSGFVDTISAVLAAHRIDSTRLEVEITESVIMDDATSVIAVLHELEARGIKLSIDDFGTGYSSLAYVKNFPVHTLKIDRSFVDDLADNSKDQAIAATIITLAHSLGMRVIAEGIETEQQLEQLRILGADDIQGYLISRPLPAPEFERFMCSYGSPKVAAA